MRARVIILNRAGFFTGARVTIVLPARELLAEAVMIVFALNKI